MGSVVELGNITTLDLDPDRALENLKGELTGFVYAGYDHDGELFIGSTYADEPTVLWLLEKAKQELLRVDEEES